MKFCHFVWLYAALYLFSFVGALLLVISLFGPPTQILALILICFPIVMRFFLDRWVVRKADSLRNSTSAPVIPVPPSGKWIEPETPLIIGSRVLVSTHKTWYRGEIVQVKSRDRFLIRIVGLDPFLDQVHHRSKLQVDETDVQEQPTVSVPKDVNLGVMVDDKKVQKYRLGE